MKLDENPDSLPKILALLQAVNNPDNKNISIFNNIHLSQPMAQNPQLLQNLSQLQSSPNVLSKTNMPGVGEDGDSTGTMGGMDRMNKAKRPLPPNFRTKPCKMFHSPIGCSRGDFCHFIHDPNFAGREIPKRPMMYPNMPRMRMPPHMMQQQQQQQPMMHPNAPHYPPAQPPPEVQNEDTKPVASMAPYQPQPPQHPPQHTAQQQYRPPPMQHGYQQQQQQPPQNYPQHMYQQQPPAQGHYRAPYQPPGHQPMHRPPPQGYYGSGGYNQPPQMQGPANNHPYPPYGAQRPRMNYQPPMSQQLHRERPDDRK